MPGGLKKKTEQRKQRSSAHSQRQRGQSAEEPRPEGSLDVRCLRRPKAGIRKPAKGKAYSTEEHAELGWSSVTAGRVAMQMV